MSEDRPKDEHARRLGYYSLSVAIGSVVVTICSLLFTIRIFQHSQKEILDVSILGVNENYQILIYHSQSDPIDLEVELEDPLVELEDIPTIRIRGASATLEIVHLNCLITNTGDRDLSIISYSLSRIFTDGRASITPTGDAIVIVDGTLIFGGIHNYGIYDQNAEPINLPFQLNVGESKLVSIKMGIPSNLHKHDLTKDYIEVGESYSYNFIRNLKFRKLISSHYDNDFNSFNSTLFKVDFITSKREEFGDVKSFIDIYLSDM